MDLSDIDLLSRDVFIESVPWAWFEYLRENAPIYKHPEPDGSGFWTFTKHGDITALHSDWQRLSSDQARGGVVGLEEPNEAEARERSHGDPGRLARHVAAAAAIFDNDGAAR